MISRLYVHNYRCFENFEQKFDKNSSVLLIGKNGAGKSSFRTVLQIFQAIGRGTTRIGELVTREDFCRGQTAIPMSFEIEAQLSSLSFKYMVTLELPERFRELRIKKEELSVGNEKIFSRNEASVTVYKSSATKDESHFNLDWHAIAMPLIQDQTAASALSTFRAWLANMVILAPIPKLMQGYVDGDNTDPIEDASNWTNWLAGLLDRHPAAYNTINDHLKQHMPDLEYFRFDRTGKEEKTLILGFSNNDNKCELVAKSLSEGEKCFFLCSVVLAANHHDGPLLTFWDEPDSHLSLDEISQFVVALRRGFQNSGQLILTSHNPEAIRRFSNNSTWIFYRRSHLEPTITRQLQDIPLSSDLIQSLINGDIEL